jgi:hypothetical protein
MEPRYWIAFGLAFLAGLAAVLAVLDSFWLIFAAFPFAFGALACIAPRGWLSNDAYRRALNALAYVSVIPAGIAMSAAVGMTLFLILGLPVLLVFVFTMWQVKTPATQ